MIELRPRDLFDASFRRRIRQSIGVKPVLLAGPVGAGAEDLARGEIEREKNAVLLEPTLGTPAEVTIAGLTAEIVDAIAPSAVDVTDQGSPAARAARTELARRYGTDATTALGVARGQPTADWTLADAVGANAGRQAIPPLRIAISNVHRLPDPLLWELRDLTSAGRAILVATTRPEHLATSFGPDSAFYGNSTTIEVPEVAARMWERALTASFHPAEAEFLQSATRGRAASTIEVLSRWEAGIAIASAWDRAVGARLREAENVLNLAAGVHSFAPRLLLAIAARRAPYTAIPSAPSQRIARALGKLRDLDLIEQPAPRRWQIADPVLQDALLERTAGRLGGDPGRRSWRRR